MNLRFLSSSEMLLVASLVILTTLPCVAECQHGDGCSCGAPELWVINSRCAPVCSGLDSGFERIKYERYDAACRRFTPETRESFLANEAERPSLFFVHGNSLDHKHAMNACWKIFEAVKRCPGPKRVVFWSWKAEIAKTKPLIRPIKLARENIRIKYTYAENQGYYLAKLTQMMSMAQPVTLSGHSFGGVTAITAAHYLGGGHLNGRVLAGGEAVERHNLRVAIVSGALDNDHVYPGCRYGQAFVPVEFFYTTFNPRDSTLSRWPIHSYRSKEAMGLTGVCQSRLGPYSHKLLQHNLTEDVRKSHYMRPHLASDRMMSAICRTAFPCGQQVSICACDDCVASAVDSYVDSDSIAIAINALKKRSSTDRDATAIANREQEELELR